MNRMFSLLKMQWSYDLLISFQTNWRKYLCEAAGLGIFMISACFVGAMLEGATTWHNALPNPFVRTVLAGILMGATALFIFYSPVTSPSGAQINPAVTITFFRLKRMNFWDAFFYVLFQMLGGTLAVYVMAKLLGSSLINAPVNYAITIPVKGSFNALMTEAIIAFVMMTMVLFVSSNDKLKSSTRIFSAGLVCVYVIIAGPISGFGMNPARSFASAIPSGIWTSFWIYAFVPIISMLLAAEFFLWFKRRALMDNRRKVLADCMSKEFQIIND